MSTVLLKPGREKSLLRRHPWIFSGAVQQVAGDPAPGETVDLLSSTWQVLARAAYSPMINLLTGILFANKSVRRLTPASS